MKVSLYVLVSVLLLASCAHRSSDAQQLAVRLGDDEATVCRKMLAVGARDVTAETTQEYYGAYRVKQRYYWWELKDRAVVAILLVGETETKLRVVTIEIGEPGKGVEGIASWRSQKLTALEQ